MWLVAPLIVLAAARSRGWRLAGSVLAGAVGVGAAVVLPFVVWAPGPFFEGVFKHWNGVTGVDTINLAYPLIELGGRRWAQAGQVAAVLATLVAAWWRSRNRDLRPAAWAAVVVFAFTVFNSVIWLYFYLTVVFLVAVAGSLPGEAALEG
jgi:hypothetical protein